MINRQKIFDKLCQDIDNPTIEIETTINGENAVIYYFNDYDEIKIVFWCDWHGDEQKFIKTSNFDSFCESMDDNLEYFTDNWDYATESVYQTYYRVDWDEWLQDNGNEYLNEFVLDQLEKHGTKYIKRSFINLLQRFVQKINYKINQCVSHITKQVKI